MMTPRSEFSFALLHVTLLMCGSTELSDLLPSELKYPRPIVAACCPHQNQFSTSTHSCASSETSLSPATEIEESLPTSWPQDKNLPVQIQYSGNFNCSALGEQSDGHLVRLRKGLVRLHRNGFLQLDGNKVLSPKRFCLDSLQESVVCTPLNCTEGTPCIRKCCSWNQHLVSNSNDEEQECEGRSPSLTPQDLVQVGGDPFWRNAENFFSAVYITGLMPQCLPRQTNLFRILGNGNIEIEYEVGSWLQISNYCLEQSQRTEKNETEKQLIAFYCDAETYEKTVRRIPNPPAVGFKFNMDKNLKGFYYQLQMWCSLVSWIFLAVTLGVYIVLWKKHSTTHGWVQFSFILAVFFYYLTRFFRRLNELNHAFDDIPEWPEMVDYFFSMAFLMNLLNVSGHMFWTFLKLTPQIQVLNKRRIVISCGVAWGFAVLITVNTAIIREGGAGLETMWLINKWIQSLILMLHFVLNVSTGAIIWLHKRDVKITQTQTFKTMLRIFINIFLLSGMLWTLKVLEMWAKGAIFERNWVWDIVQVLTYTYGLVLFALLVCNQRILGALMEQCPNISNIFNTGTGARDKGSRSSSELVDEDMRLNRVSYTTQTSNDAP